MSKIITVATVKGGVAKTSSVVNIATILADRGNNVLLIDLDKQSNSTLYLNRYDESCISMYDVLKCNNHLSDIIVETDIKNLYLAPASIKMIELENVYMDDEYYILSDELKEFKEFDFIIIDCPPDLNMIVNNALAASTDVLVPIKLDNWALMGFSYMLDRIEEIKNYKNPMLKFTGAFITLDRKRTVVSKELKKVLKEQLGDKFFETSISLNQDVVNSTFKPMPLVRFKKSAKASIDYFNLTDELLKKL